MKSAVDENTARETYQVAAQTYADVGKPDNFVVKCACDGMSRPDEYARLLKS